MDDITYLPEEMPKHYAILPLKDKVLIRRDESPEKSEIIIIPDSFKTPALSGIVVAVGPGVQELVLGDSVVFGQYVGSTLRVQNRVYLCVKEVDCHVVIRERDDDAPETE